MTVVSAMTVVSLVSRPVKSDNASRVGEALVRLARPSALLDLVPELLAQVREHARRVEQVGYRFEDLEAWDSRPMGGERARGARATVSTVLHTDHLVAAVLESTYRVDQLGMGGATRVPVDRVLGASDRGDRALGGMYCQGGGARVPSAQLRPLRVVGAVDLEKDPLLRR